MSENLFCPEQKGTNKKYREGWDRIFGKKEDKEDSEKEGEKENDF